MSGVGPPQRTFAPARRSATASRPASSPGHISRNTRASTPSAARGDSLAPLTRVPYVPHQCSTGELAPGTLTVRVVRGGFAGNLSSREVVLDVLGGDTRTARTNVEGRAEFADVPVGAHIRASVLVDGERLESAVFPMPTDSGVRVLLATGAVGADAVPAPADDPPGTPPLEMTAALMRNENRRPASPPGPHPVDDGGLMASVLGVSALAFATVVIIRRSKSSRES